MGGDVSGLAAFTPAATVRLEPPEAYVTDRLGMLEARLDEVCEDLGRTVPGVTGVLASAVGTEGRGGRRWRPLLTVAAAEACGGTASDALDAAVAVELTHTASLALDDLPCMDDAAERRGLPATHRLVGSAGAILLSVGLLARAVELLGDLPRAGGALTAEWGRTVGLQGMAGGQAIDVTAKGPLRGAERRLHRTKSTLLPAFALSAGARSAGADEGVRAGLESFGRFVGWAYQLVDDVRDLGEDIELGRAQGSARPLAHSRRLLRLATRRLVRLPGLKPDGVAVLLGLAAQVVGLEDVQPEEPLGAGQRGDR
jgi:geranylgeranyl diphosphate synthase type II